VPAKPAKSGTKPPRGRSSKLARTPNEAKSSEAQPEQVSSLVSGPVGPSALLKPGEDLEAFRSNFEANLADDLGDPTAASELLAKCSALPIQWPSTSFGPVEHEVLVRLLRARAILTSKGFFISEDPVNPWGDGRRWMLKCGTTDGLTRIGDPADLADSYLMSEGISVGERPAWVGLWLMVGLWDSGRVQQDREEIRAAKIQSPKEYKSEWRRTIYQAVVKCGREASSQVLANWIEENHPDVALPKGYLKLGERIDRVDISQLVRLNTKARMKFAKDVSKIKIDLGYSRSRPSAKM
jgi:hypothetical protein